MKSLTRKKPKIYAFWNERAFLTRFNFDIKMGWQIGIFSSLLSIFFHIFRLYFIRNDEIFGGRFFPLWPYPYTQIRHFLVDSTAQQNTIFSILFYMAQQNFSCHSAKLSTSLVITMNFVTESNSVTYNVGYIPGASKVCSYITQLFMQYLEGRNILLSHPVHITYHC